MKNSAIVELKSLYPEGELQGRPFFTTDIKVRWEEMDVNGHVNYASYMDYYSEARIEAVGQEFLRELRDQGFGPAVYKADVDYVKELFHPDTVHIVTWLDEMISKTRISIRQNMYSMENKELISKAKFNAIFMDLKRRKPVRMPDELKRKFGLLVV